MSVPQSRNLTGPVSMPNDLDRTLYSLPPLRLVALPAGLDREQFWDDLAGELTREQGVGHVMTFERMAGQRVVRVVLNDGGSATAIHYAIGERQLGGGSCVLSLQPLTAWARGIASPDWVPLTPVGARSAVTLAEGLLPPAARKAAGAG